MSYQQYTDDRPFLDLLFCTLLGFVFLFVVAFLQISQKTEETAKIESNAEFIITVEWSKDVDIDVDTWVKSPNGNVIYYRYKEADLIVLDRDDVGFARDYVIMPDGQERRAYLNEEIVTIRGILPGEYILNLNLYNCKQGYLPPVPVKVKISKLNPTASVVLSKEVTLEYIGEEMHITRFTIDPQGGVTLDDIRPVQLITFELIESATPHGSPN